MPGAQAPTVLSPVGRVSRGYTGPFRVDFSKTPLGYYDMELFRVVDGSKWFDAHMWSNDMPDTVVRWTIDDPLPPGKYYIRIWLDSLRESTTYHYFKVGGKWAAVVSAAECGVATLSVVQLQPRSRASARAWLG